MDLPDAMLPPVDPGNVPAPAPAARHPQWAEALAAQKAGRHAEAEQIWARVLAATPGDAGAGSNLGVSRRALGRSTEAILCHRRAVALAPGLAVAHHNLGVTLRGQGRIAEASNALRQATTLDPHKAGSWQALADTLLDLGREAEAIEALRAGLVGCGAVPELALLLGQALLATGAFAEGWERFEERWRCARPPRRTRTGPVWDGSDLGGRTLLLFAEQGFGDAIQLLRYVPLAARRGGRVVVELRPEMVTLARAAPSLAGIEIIPRGVAGPPHDLVLPMFSLPRLFATGADSIPGGVPYLAAEPAALARWRARIGAGPGPAVGLCWAGSPTHVRDRARSLPTWTLRRLLAVPGARFFSLQREPRAGDWEALSGAPIVNLAEELEDFAATAAAISALDLVISVDTSVVHLCGALGRPCIVLLPVNADFRWLRGRADSPWYPTLRLLRQRQPGDWGPVLEDAAAALAQAVAAHPGPAGSAPAAG